MDHERWFESIQGVEDLLKTQTLREDVLASLPQARETLEGTDLSDKPLSTIRMMTALTDIMVSHDPDLAFSNVCNILVMIEEAENKGYSEEEIRRALRKNNEIDNAG